MTIETNSETAPIPITSTTSTSRGKRRLWPWLIAAGGLVALALFSLGAFTPRREANPRRGPDVRPVPIVAVPTRSGDLSVYQTGLGTVTPINAVTVRSRVDGQLMSVAYREGQVVQQGELLAQIDPRPFEVQLHQAAGQLAKDQAARANAKADLERYKALFAQGSLSSQQLDTQAASVDQYEAAIKSDQAQVESAQLNLTYSRITAPISGVVGLRLVDPGNVVRAGDANGLCVITQQQPIGVLFTVPADQLQPILARQKAHKPLVVEAWNRDLTAKLATGSVLAVDNQIDQATGTVRIKALFPNDDSALYPNQFVNARMLVDTLHAAILAPNAAIQRSPQSTFVYVVKQDETVEMRTVRVKLSEGDDSAVDDGLAAGELVVVDGIDKLQPGSRVSLATSRSEKRRKP